MKHGGVGTSGMRTRKLDNLGKPHPISVTLIIAYTLTSQGRRGQVSPKNTQTGPRPYIL